MTFKVRIAAILFASAVPALAVRAQDTVPPTAAEKQFARMDLAISGAGMFTRNVSGPVTAKFGANTGQTVGVSPSSTVGVLATLRYVKSPFFGFEGNYSYARFTENYSTIGGVQTQANEFSLGYVVTPSHTIFGFQPFVFSGGGRH